MEKEIEDLISKMERSRARLNIALDKVAPQIEVYPTWKTKQILDHIAGWDELVYASLQAYSEGNPPPSIVEMNIDQYNSASVADRRDLSLEQSGQACKKSRARVIQALKDLSPEMLSKTYPAPWGGMCTIPSIMKIFVSHELEHARQIEKVLKSSNPTE